MGTEELQYIDRWDKVERCVANVGAVRDAVGPHIGIGVDFDGRVHKPMAKVLLRELEPFHLMFVETVTLSAGKPQLLQAVGTRDSARRRQAMRGIPVKSARPCS